MLDSHKTSFSHHATPFESQLDDAIIIEIYFTGNWLQYPLYRVLLWSKSSTYCERYFPVSVAGVVTFFTLHGSNQNLKASSGKKERVFIYSSHPEWTQYKRENYAVPRWKTGVTNQPHDNSTELSSILSQTSRGYLRGKAEKWKTAEE